MRDKQAELKAFKQSVIDQCLTGNTNKPCERIEDNLCVSYLNPKSKWTRGNCPMSTNFIVEIKDTKKVRVGQQKQKKK